MNGTPGSPRILAVDDVEAKRYTWEKILTRAGFQVFSASTGNEALARMKEKPDLVVLDVRLPDMSGSEVCRRIKSGAESASTPVLHVSASLISPEDRAAALEGGADGYLTEPVEPEELIATVRALLRMKRAEDDARRASTEWRSTFDALRDGVALLDAAGRIIRSNESFQKLTGFPPDGAPEVPFRALLERSAEPRDPALLDALADFRRRRDAELRWDGRWVRISIDPVAEGGNTAAIAVLTDETDRKRAEEQAHGGREALKTLNLELEKRVEERTRRLQSAVSELEAFTYTIAHDLRAPLRSMHRFSEILESEYGPALGDEGRDFARRIVAGAGRMDALIDDLLSYSRLSQSALEPGRQDAARIAREAARSLGIDGAPGVDLRIDEAIPAVVGDRVLLYQSFLNLLANAAKFVSPGVTPQIRVAGTRVGDRVTLSVRDNGIGIPLESQRRLFRVFERLGESRDYPGTGIGLAIVRRAIERMNGEWGVDSEPGKGSRFWIRLPAAEEAPS